MALADLLSASASSKKPNKQEQALAEILALSQQPVEVPTNPYAPQIDQASLVKELQGQQPEGYAVDAPPLPPQQTVTGGNSLASVLSDIEGLSKQQQAETLADKLSKSQSKGELLKAFSPQLDLSPAINFFREWNGKTGDGGYKAPDNYANTIAAAQKLYANEKPEISQLDLLKQKLEAVGLPMKAIAAQSRSDIGKQNLDFRKEQSAAADVSKIEESILKQRNSLDDLLYSFDSGNIQDIGSALSQYSRNIAGEKGVLTDQDIARVLPKTLQADVAKWKTYFSNDPTGNTIPKEQIALLKAHVAESAKRLEEAHARRFEALKAKKLGSSSNIEGVRNILNASESKIIKPSSDSQSSNVKTEAPIPDWKKKLNEAKGIKQ